jgi:hypothetical protein
LNPIASDLQCVLSVLARHGTDSDESATGAFQQASIHLQRLLKKPLTLQPAAESSWDAFAVSLKRLNEMSFPLKGKLLEACIACIAEDGRFSVEEGDMMRAIASCLNCPCPLLSPLEDME